MTGYELVPGLALLLLYGAVLVQARPPLVAPDHKRLAWRLAVVTWVALVLGGLALLAVQRGWV